MNGTSNGTSNILGIGGLPQNASASLIRNGAIVAAVEQGKVSRQRGPNPYPAAAIAECLRLGGVSAEEIGTVALSEMPLDLGAQFRKAHVVQVSHHQAHAASAYYASPFESATVLTFDRHGSYRDGEPVLLADRGPGSAV